MTELDPNARLVVQLAKRGSTPDRTDRERVREALRQALEKDPRALGVVRGRRSVGRRQVAAAGWTVAAILIASVAAAATTAVVQRWDRGLPEDTETPATSPVVGPRAGTHVATRPSVAPASPSLTAPEPTPAPAPSARLVRSQPTRRPPATAPEPAPRSATLAEEVALLRRARDALADGRLDDATRALAIHRTRAPRGALTEDREALLAIARCRRQQNADLAAGFARRWPDSALGSGVTAACGVD